MFTWFLALSGWLKTKVDAYTMITNTEILDDNLTDRVHSFLTFPAQSLAILSFVTTNIILSTRYRLPL